MINRIIEFSASHKFLVLLFTGFAVVGGIYALRNVPLDAIPDLSDPQVIIYTEWPGRSPDLVEAQITYPIVSAMLAAPNVSVVRGLSDYGFSYVYVVFDEGTDIYWGRSRVLEYMSKFQGKLPEGVSPRLGPDATGVGWAYQYALVDRTGRQNLAELRSFNDWYVRYWLESVPGVAEVAVIGGFVKQYQISVDPNRLNALKVPLNRVIDMVRMSNNEVGGRVVEFTGKEYIVRGRGYIKSTADIESISVGNDPNGTPILLRQVADVQLGPEMRRGVSELNGEGEVTGGIVVVRFGENALAVIDRVKAKFEEVKGSFPEGVEVVTTYDRSDLIHRSIETLTGTLIEELVIVSVVILVFLRHVPSAMVPIATIPIAIIISFIPMYFSGFTSNIMSLGGIAIAIGAMVDAAIIVVEQTHKKLERWDAEGRPGDPTRVIVDAVKEVGGPSFFSLLVIAVSFFPIFALEAQEGRLFKPLAFTKNASMAIAAVLAITLGPVMLILFTRVKDFEFRPRLLARVVNKFFVKIEPEEHSWLNRTLMRIYTPVLRLMLRLRWLVLAAAVAIVALTVPVYMSLGSEFMPPLNEGTILYMPITLPGISVTEATKYLQIQDRLIKQVPEVSTVFGKIGKTESSTDPAPFSMVETTVVLKPEAEWRKIKRQRFYSSWPLPDFGKAPFRFVWPEERRIGWEALIDEMDKAVQLPAYANAWLFPIRTRIDMITTGVRTPVGVKVLGPDLATIEKIGLELEEVLKDVAGTRSAFFERVTGGYYIDFEVNRLEAARYGLSLGNVQDIIESAIGGNNVTTTVEGRGRYPVNVRYARELRDDLSNLRRVLVPTEGGAQVPLEQLATITMRTGAPMIKNEEGFLAGFLYVDVTADRDLGGYVEDARRAVVEKVKLPAGYQLQWSGQYEYMVRVRERLKTVVPFTLVIVFMLIYFNTGSMVKTSIILLAVPFSAVGAILFIWALGYNISIAVWVGLIALLGVDAETGVFMLLYLDLARDEAKRNGQLRTRADLREAIMHGAAKRLRPKVMMVVVLFLALTPIMWSDGAGADVMKRIAAPMLGGIFTSFIMELLVYPVIYELWRERELEKAVA